MEFFDKPIIKNGILSFLTIIIGAICSSLGTWDSSQKYFYPKLVFIFLFGILYIVVLVYYSTKEANLNNANSELLRQNLAFNNAMEGIVSICKHSSSSVNKIVHNIISEGKIDLQIWSFDIACTQVCKELYDLVCLLHGKRKDFCIVYVKLNEGTNTICTNAFANQNMQKPSILNKNREINDISAYHDAELFQRGTSDFEILLNKEAIRDAFKFNNNANRDRNKNKYNQYMAIPVFCNDSKMIGLLEIVCLKKTVLADTEEELNEIISKYFVPYANLTLLLYKLEKSLLATPNTK